MFAPRPGQTTRMAASPRRGYGPREKIHRRPGLIPYRLAVSLKRGAISGASFENEKELNFSLLTGVRPLIETMSLAKAFDAKQRMKSGDAKFRMVLTMEGRRHAH